MIKRWLHIGNCKHVSTATREQLHFKKKLSKISLFNKNTTHEEDSESNVVMFKKYYHGENNEKGPNMFLPQQSIRQKSPFAKDKEVKGPQSTYISRCVQIMIV